MPIGSSFSIENTTPDFVIKVEGEEFKLRYDFGAFRAYEKQTGVNVLTQEKFLVGIDQLPAFVWSGLLRFHPDITLDQVDAWVTPRTVAGLRDLALEAYYAAFPEPDPETPKVDPPSA